MTAMGRSAYGLDSGAELDWRQRAECATGQYDPNLWTSPADADLGQARWVCQRQCPVLVQCLKWAAADPSRVDGTVAGGVAWVRQRGQCRPSRSQPVPRPPTGRPAHTDAPIARAS